jgi:hypothetical protein
MLLRLKKHITRLANTGSAKSTRCLDSLHVVSLAVASGVKCSHGSEA